MDQRIPHRAEGVSSLRYPRRPWKEDQDRRRCFDSRWKFATTELRLGEITELIESRDGYERGAVLQVVSKKGKHIKLRRPIQKLFPLEVNTGKPPENGNVRAVQQTEPRPETSRPPRRAMAATTNVIRRLVDQQWAVGQGKSVKNSSLPILMNNEQWDIRANIIFRHILLSDWH